MFKQNSTLGVEKYCFSFSFLIFFIFFLWGERSFSCFFHLCFIKSLSKFWSFIYCVFLLNSQIIIFIVQRKSFSNLQSLRRQRQVLGVLTWNIFVFDVGN